MKIDRHNYEEFFLLYVDDELTAEQKRSVDQFVRENPDLAIELEILQQTTLQPDDSIVFKGKENLFKTETESIINLTNYEEYIISYIDNELSGAERMELFAFAEKHPHVKEELAIYEQTKLQPEKEIFFANKEILYRKEEPVKVISIRWWKVAVAAAVILAIGVTSVKVLNKSTTIEPGVANNTKQGAEKNKPTPATKQTEQKQQPTLPVEVKNNNEEVAATNKAEQLQKEVALPKPVKQKQLDKVAVPDLQSHNDNAIAQNDNPVRSNDLTNHTTSEPKAIESTKQNDLTKVNNNDVAVNTNSTKENNSKTTVTPKTDESLDNNKEVTPDITNDSAVYASYDEGKNKKLRGFFRKAARVFERRTNISASDDEDKQDKVLIGALAVKLK
ncbi:MAG: hypothetical protein QM764_03925 [Chitinophagaceae bacterium]